MSDLGIVQDEQSSTWPQSDESNNEGEQSYMDDDPEINMYSNFTQQQLNHVIKHTEEKIVESNNKIAKLQSQIDSLENKKCITERTEDENKELRAQNNELQQELVFREGLITRCKHLKTVKPKYQPIPIDEIPRVIICSQWGNGMPKIAVCGQSKRTKGSSKKLKEEFKQVMTPRQIEQIEDEKRWMDLTCGELELQIAGLRGQVRTITNENNVIRAVVEQERDNKPRKKLNKKKETAKKKSVLNSNQKQEDDTCAVLAITISSSRIGEESTGGECPLTSLQSSLEDVQKSSQTLKAQQDALTCLKRSITSTSSEDEISEISALETSTTAS